MIKDSNITMMVNDLDKSIEFYQSLGFTLKNRWGDHYAQLTAPGLAIGLHPASDTNPAGSVSIGFTTDNFGETKSSLQKLSIEAADRQEEGGQFLHFSDPDGIDLYFIKPKY